MQRFDAIVIGAGANGCATALALAQAGVRVLLLEQFEFGHARGSSHGDSRIIRLSYEHLDLVRYAQAAYAAWDDIEGLSGEKLRYRTGGVDFAEPGNLSWEACRRNLAQSEISHQVLGAEELRRRFTQFALAPRYVALWQADTGFMHAAHALRTMARLAQHYGAELVDRAPVAAIEKVGAQWRVQAGESRFVSDRLVIAAGAWVNRVLACLGLRLPVQVMKEQWAYFATRGSSDFALGRMPIFIDYATLNYGFPEFSRPGVKVATHHAGTPVDVAQRDFAPNEDNLRALSAWIETTLPGLEPVARQAQTCLYTNTPDCTFLIDRLPGEESAVVVSACSGEGFKFSAQTGRVAARLLLEGEAPPARFGWRAALSPQCPT